MWSAGGGHDDGDDARTFMTPSFACARRQDATSKESATTLRDPTIDTRPTATPVPEANTAAAIVAEIPLGEPLANRSVKHH